MKWRYNYYICNMELELYKEDILKIGEYIVSIEGNVGITVDAYDNSLGLKEIILRNILKLYGNQYTVLRVDDYAARQKRRITEVISLVIVTNLPLEEVWMLMTSS